MLRLFLIKILCVLTFSLFAQMDTTYVEPYPNSDLLAIHTTLKKFQISFSSAVTQSATFQNHNLGLGIRLKIKRVGLSFSVPVVTYNESVFGKPRSFGLGFNLYPRNFYVRGLLRYFRGFDNLNADNSLENPVFRADNQMWLFQLTGHYIFNGNRYSLRSAFKFVNRQKRSAGSWVLAIPVSYQWFAADSLRLPLSDNVDFQLDRYESIKLGLGGGYGYNQVWNNWSLNGLVTGGVEFRHLNYRNANTLNERNQFRVSPRLQIIGSFIYNERRWFSGIVGRYLPGIDAADGINTRIENWWLRVTVGRRFL